VPVQVNSEIITLTAEEKAVKDEMERLKQNGQLPTKPKFD
jgi:hypothetical protein